jgi:hypothetical protein
LSAGTALAGRRRAGERPPRRPLALMIGVFAPALVMIALLLLAGVFAELFFPRIQQIRLAVLGLAPAAFLAGLLQARLARVSVGDLVVELRAEPVDLRGPPARALRDPS